VELDTLVWAMAALAEGLGLRAVARVFEVDPNTVLGWLIEAAEHLEAFSHYFLRDVAQVQMDELFALLSAVKDGEITEAQAIQRLSRSPHWVPDDGCRGSHAGHGSAPRPSAHPSAGSGLLSAVSDGRLSGVPHRVSHALRPVASP
jgi:hypothetical protein